MNVPAVPERSEHLGADRVPDTCGAIWGPVVFRNTTTEVFRRAVGPRVSTFLCGVNQKNNGRENKVAVIRECSSIVPERSEHLGSERVQEFVQGTIRTLPPVFLLALGEGVGGGW